ncbi:hypothetical protein [Luteococcus peritonei]|uniref:Uncharacterized protein n=1 Tax=Luteococcus peritonei TaxID=88874 RepID=A0ABW4RVE9_9ACTN
MNINPRNPFIVKSSAAALSSLIVLGGWMVDGQATSEPLTPSVSSSASTTETEEEIKAQQQASPSPSLGHGGIEPETSEHTSEASTPAAVTPPRVTVQDCRLSEVSPYAGAALVVDVSEAATLSITMNWGSQSSVHKVPVQAGMNKLSLYASEGEPTVREVTRCTVKAVTTAP